MPMHYEGNFPDIPHERCPTSAGEVGVPILYAQTTYVLAVFRIDHAPAQAAVQHLGLDAVRLPGARAFAVLTFAEYGDSTIGPYGETGLALATVAAGADAGFPSIVLLASRLGSATLAAAVFRAEGMRMRLRRGVDVSSRIAARGPDRRGAWDAAR